MTILNPYVSVDSYATLYRFQRDWARNHLRRGDLSFMLQDAIMKIISERDPEYLKKFDKKFPKSL